MSLGIVLPAALDASGSKGSGHAVAFHRSLLLSVRHPLSLSSFTGIYLALCGRGKIVWPQQGALLAAASVFCTTAAELLRHGCLVKNRSTQPWMSTWVTLGYAVQVQELTQAAGEADLQELYSSAPQLLSGYGNQPSRACPLLQVRSHIYAVWYNWHRLAD